MTNWTETGEILHKRKKDSGTSRTTKLQTTSIKTYENNTWQKSTRSKRGMTYSAMKMKH